MFIFLGGRDKYIVWTLDFKERETVKRLRWGTENLRLEKQKESTLNAHCFLLHVFPFFFKFIFIYLLIFGIRILIYLLSLFFERWLDNSATISRQNLSGKLYSNFPFFFFFLNKLYSGFHLKPLRV